MMFIVTGASGSGKSACLPGLRATFPSIDWHDFDEFGVPSPCPREWRPRTTERSLQVALDNLHRSQDTGLLGGAILGEILACPSAPRLEIRVALLDCQDVLRLDRLRMRGTQGATQETLSWAAWQRVHAVDPQWRQDVICSPELGEMDWERWTSWRRGDPRWRVHAIDMAYRVVMMLPEHLLAKLKNHGLEISGPWQEGKSGWLGRYMIAKGPWVEHGGISVLGGPILWIYEEDGFWFAVKYDWVPGPGPTDFRCKDATAEEAVDRVLQFFCSQEYGPR